MIHRLTSALSSRIPSSLSFALFTTTASSSNPSPAQLRTMAIKELVEDTIAKNKVTIFSKSWCPYCKQVKGLFANNFPEVVPVVFELDEREDGAEIQHYLHQKTGQRTVPSVFVNQKHVGGNDDAQAKMRSGELAKLVNA